MAGIKEFEHFKETMKQMVMDKMGCNYDVVIHQITKNNGITLNGILISDEETKISPTIYLEDYYRDFKTGESLEDIASKICDCYDKNKIPKFVDAEEFLIFDNMKSKIAFKLINAEQNKSLLEDIPHVPFLDLEIVFYCLLSVDDNDFATALIHNKHLIMWGITNDELYELAKVNTPKLLKATLSSMESILQTMLGDSCNEDELEEILSLSDCDTGMFVLTNTANIFGAATIMYPEILSCFADKVKSDLFVLPSSTDEVIIVKVREDMKREELDVMVKEVNETVEPEKVLANHSYYYDRMKRELVL